MTYEEMQTCPHPEPKHHRRMPAENRAFQFAPFAALTGFGAAIAETSRETERKIELTEEEWCVISGKLRYLLTRPEEKRRCRIEYFLPDARKAGGRFASLHGCLRRIDEASGELVLADGKRIPIGEVVGFELLKNSKENE